MAAPEAQALTPYPAPPPFYKLYGNDNPPPPPTVPASELDEVNVFGQALKLDEPLVPPLRVPQLYVVNEDGTIDYKGELLRLSKELKFLFVELLKSLTDAPSQYARLLTTANHVMHNMVHLVNLMRPHQARSTLECILQFQVERQQNTLQKLQEAIASADKTLLESARALVEVQDSAMVP